MTQTTPVEAPRQENRSTLAKLKNPALDDIEGRVAEIADILDDLKAIDIVALDLREVTDFTDFFVIATARSETHMKAMGHQTYSRLRKQGLGPFVPIEDSGLHWTILDYGNVVVHLMDAEARERYALEELWGDGDQFEWRNVATA